MSDRDCEKPCYKSYSAAQKEKCEKHQNIHHGCLLREHLTQHIVGSFTQNKNREYPESLLAILTVCCCAFPLTMKLIRPDSILEELLMSKGTDKTDAAVSACCESEGSVTLTFSEKEPPAKEWNVGAEAAGNAEHAAASQSSSDDAENIGPYQVLSTIGTGGMGVVYKVKHRGAGTVLAMKVLKQELTADPINVKRFQQELKAASLINHPNVLPIYDNGVTEDGRPYLVMEYLDGYTLEEILSEEGFLDLERFVQIFTQVCDALSTAHEKRIIHRDLKPSNIMVTTSDTGFELVKVLDFGIARVFQKAAKDGARLTQLGEVLGSPLYMSPEQCLSQKLDERSDIYALGVVMYEALTGVTPFPGENPVEIIMAHLQKRPASMNSVRPDFNIPPELENLIFMCLEKEVSLRPERLQEVSVELQRVAQSLKSRRSTLNFKQWQKRLRFSAKRKVRQLLERKDTWMRPAVASIATACLCGLVYQYSQPVASVADFIGKADAAMVRDQIDDVAANWDKAIELAEKNHATPLQLAMHHEEAADSIVSHTYNQLGLSSNYSQWNLVRRDDNGDYTRNSFKRAALAKPHLLKALDMGSEADRRRITDKLITVASVQNDLPTIEKYLREQLNRDPLDLDHNILEHMATVLERQNRTKEAEPYLNKLWRLQESQRHEPFPHAMDRLASLYHREGRFDEEVKMRSEIVELIRASRLNGNHDNYTFREHLIKLSNALRKVGKLPEAKAASIEAGAIKDGD